MLRVALGLVTFAGAGQLGAATIGQAWDGDRAPAGNSHPSGRLVAAAPCQPEQTGASGAPAEASTVPLVGQRVGVTVPATVFLRRPLGGPLLVAVTNTGCPPRADDDLWRVGPRRQHTRVAWPSIQRLTWVAVAGEPGTYLALPRSKAHGHT